MAVGLYDAPYGMPIEETMLAHDLFPKISGFA